MSEPTVRFHTVPLNHAEGALGVAVMAVSYTHLTLPTSR